MSYLMGKAKKFVGKVKRLVGKVFLGKVLMGKVALMALDWDSRLEPWAETLV